MTVVSERYLLMEGCGCHLDQLKLKSLGLTGGEQMCL